MRRHAHGRTVVGILVALVIAGLAVYLGGGWGIVVVEGAGALLLAIVYLRSMNDRENGDVDG